MKRHMAGLLALVGASSLMIAGGYAIPQEETVTEKTEILRAVDETAPDYVFAPDATPQSWPIVSGNNSWYYYGDGESVIGDQSGLSFKGFSSLSVYSDHYLTDTSGSDNNAIKKVRIKANSSDISTMSLWINGSFLDDADLSEETGTFTFALDNAVVGQIEIRFEDQEPRDFVLSSVEVWAEYLRRSQDYSELARELMDIRTCSLEEGNLEKFRNLKVKHQNFINLYGSNLKNVMIYDLVLNEDGSYSSHPGAYVDFMSKYNACLNRLGSKSGSLGLLGQDAYMGTIVGVLLSSLALLGISAFIIRKRKHI